MGKNKNRQDAEPSRDKDTGKKLKKDTTQLLQEISLSDAETNSLRTTKIRPVVAKFSSVNPTERAEGVQTAATLLKDGACRLLLLKERVVEKLMEDMLNDSNLEVVVYSWRALRTIAEEEGEGHCINMFRKGILESISVTISKLSSSIGPGASDLVWSLADNVIGLLNSLSEINQDILEKITQMDILPILAESLNPAAKAPEYVQTTVAKCLESLTQDNDAFSAPLLEDEAFVTRIMQLKGPSENSLKRIVICGIIHNLSLTEGGHEAGITDSAILPILTSTIEGFSASAVQTSKDDNALETIQVDLEVLASIATAAGYELETGISTEGEAIEDSVSDDEEDPSAEADDVIMEDLDNDSDNIPLPQSVESIMKHLIQKTTPALVKLLKSTPQSLISLQTRALDALNNIAWTASNAVREDSHLRGSWEKQIDEIWKDVISPVLKADTADYVLADAVTGLAWALAKSVKGNLDLSQGQHRAFMSLYHAAKSDDLRTKCVGVNGCLALPEDRVDINKEIGVFLVTLLASAPEVPAECAVEALNAIFDIYADADLPYDKPVFVESGFLEHLTALLPNIRTMARRVNKSKLPELRLKVDEAVLNLQRFVQYKKKERSKQ